METSLLRMQLPTPTWPLAQIGTYVITLQCVGDGNRALADATPYANLAFGSDRDVCHNSTVRRRWKRRSCGCNSIRQPGLGSESTVRPERHRFLNRRSFQIGRASC